MTHRICVINGKGGCGKTTISTHLAAAYANSGLFTELVDLDPLRGATAWHKRRGGKNAPIILTSGRDKTPSSPRVQRVIVDCPASMRSAKVRDAVRSADVLIIPLLPSIFDEHATKRFMRRLEAALDKTKKGRPTLIVSNRYRRNSVACVQLESFIEKLHQRPIAHIPDRSIYTQLAQNGQSIFDVGARVATSQQEYWMPLIEAIETYA